MAIEDEDRQRDIRALKLRQLRALEAQHATMGTLTPPHITIQIETLRRELQMTETILASPIEPKFAEGLGADGRFIVTLAKIEELGRELRTGLHYMGERVDRVEEFGQERWEREREDRRDGQRRTRLVNIAFCMLFALLIYLIVTRL